MRRMLTTAIASGAVLTMGAAYWNDNDRLTLQVQKPYGQYVADADGRAVYMFTRDVRGRGKQKAESYCYGACAESWPPVLVADMPRIDPRLEKDLMASIRRKDGEVQLTYGGWPLYYWVEDRLTDRANGQNIYAHGGYWHLVAPDGSTNDTKRDERPIPLSSD